MNDSISLLHKILNSIYPIPEKEWQKLVCIIKQKDIKKGDNYEIQGESAQNVYFLLSGSVRMFYTNSSGKEFIKAFNFQNDFIASYSSLILNCPSNHTIQCMEDSEYLYFKWKELQLFSMDHICWQIINRKIIEKEFLEKERREYQLAMLEAKDRYYEFLKEIPPEIVNKIPKKYISSYLGIAPSTFSRMKTKI